MSNGTTRMIRNIKIGDQLMKCDNLPLIVNDIQKERTNLYEMITDEGTKYIIGENFELCLKYTDNEIRREDENGNKNEKWFVKYFEDFSLKKIYFDSFHEASMYMSKIPNESSYGEISVKKYLELDHEITKSLKLYQSSVNYQLKKVQFDPYNFGFWMMSEQNRTSEDLIHDDEYGTWIKGIPDSYKINERKIRLEFLAGMIDANHSYDFVNYNDGLSNDIIELARSLGLKVNLINGNSTFIITGDISVIPCKKIEIQEIKDTDKNFIVISKEIGDAWKMITNGGKILSSSFTVVN
jgi:hypothetical protein